MDDIDTVFVVWDSGGGDLFCFDKDSPKYDGYKLAKNRREDE